MLYPFFTNTVSLRKATEEVLNDLNNNCNQGNQYIVVIGLTESAHDQLGSDGSPFRSLDYQITLDGVVGIISYSRMTA